MRFLGSNPPVSRHLANPAGRDFIVGDLHGCRAMLDGLLAQVSFDTEKDRLFSVGDLVDRGPDSEGCLALLEEPWFYPVLGNHDAMLMAWIYGKTRDRRQRDYEYSFTHNDGWQWVNRFHKASQYLPLLERTPFIRVIGEGDGRFHVAHAELVDVAANVYVFADAMLDNLSTEKWDREHYIVGYNDVGTWTDHVFVGSQPDSRGKKPCAGGSAFAPCCTTRPFPDLCGPYHCGPGIWWKQRITIGGPQSCLFG